MSFAPGSTFINDIAPGLPQHLWVVIAIGNPSGKIAIVNCTTWEPSCQDESCVIQPGEHPFVKHKTVVNYRDAKIVTTAQLNQVRSLVQPHANANSELLERICQGARESRFTSKKILRLLES